jgi:hypothetical protein
MNLSRLATVAAAVMVLGGALPSVAGAADYCVAPNQGCGANNVPSLQDALDMAASTQAADRVLLGAHTYVAPGPTGFKYPGTSAVEIAGSGRGVTTITGQPGAQDRLLYLMTGSGTSIHDLTLRIPPDVAANFKALHTEGVARRIEIVADGLQTHEPTGAVLLAGGVLEDSTVALDSAPGSTGAVLGESNALTGPSTVRASTVRGGTGVAIYGPGVVERSRVSGTELAVLASGGYTALRDSLLKLNTNVGAALQIDTSANTDTDVRGDGLTIIAPQLPDTGGVLLKTAPDPSLDAQLMLHNSIVRGGTPLAAVASGSGAGRIFASYSDYDAAANVVWGPTADINEHNVSNLGDAAGMDHDYALLPSSPLIDAGDPVAAQGFDLNGNARVADGNGDGIARRDLGAFELQSAMAGPPSEGGTSGGPAADTQAPLISGPAADTQAPLISDFRSTRSVFAVARAATPRAARAARGTRLRYTLSENARVALKIQRRLAGQRARYRTVGTLRRSGLSGSNRIRFTGRIGRRALRPGRYRAVMRATDPAGNRSAPKVAPFRVIR